MKGVAIETNCTHAVSHLVHLNFLGDQLGMLNASRTGLPFSLAHKLNHHTSYLVLLIIVVICHCSDGLCEHYLACVLFAKEGSDT